MTHRTQNAQPVGVIYTGGTFGMVQSARGYTPSTDLPARAEAELQSGSPNGSPRIAWIPFADGQPITSSDATPRLWFDLAQTIAAHADQCAGFVIIHGTDTLAFTGAALSFLLAGLGKPVIVTGASAPLGEPDSDAAANLHHALQVAAGGRSAEVTIAFGRFLLRANRTTKRHENADDLFTSPGLEPLATLGDPIEYHGVEAPPGPYERPTLPLAGWRDTRVAMLPAYPGLGGELVRAACGTGIGALLLEAYPSGVAPGGDAGFVAAVAEAVAAGIVVGAVSQSRHGWIRMGKYAISTPLAEAGMIGGEDMTREAALAKLHFLLSSRPDPAARARDFARDLAGELTPLDTA